MRRLHRKISTLLAIGMTFWLSGCYAIMDDVIECENSLVNCYRAYSAWGEHNDDLDVDHRSHFRKGFLEGYKEAATNGSSSYGQCQNENCLPLMPPRCYWKHCYQNCEGRQKIDAWYQGYAHGAMAASQDGAYENYIIPTYGLHNGQHQPGAQHTTSLEEDLIYGEHDQLVPEPDEAVPNSDRLLPVPETYDGLPKIPPAEEEPQFDEPISGVSFEYYERNNKADWLHDPPAIPAADRTTDEVVWVTPSNQQTPKARFTDVTTTELASEHARKQISGKFVLPVGYEGFRAPEWSEGASRE